MTKTDVETRLDGAVKDYIPASMLDWEGKVASVLFIGGCNFSCAFCHNPELIRHPEKLKSVSFDEITDYLTDKQGWIDGVVITGGEPTLTPSLRDIIERIRFLDLPVKLDTNGSRPDILADLISEGLLDYVAMDIKAVFDKYGSVTNSQISPLTIEESINLIIRSRIHHEFRTTAYPAAVTLVDIVEISDYLGNMSAERYAIQQFRNDRVLNEEAAKVKPYWIKDLERAAEECNKNLPTKLR
ncbi:MAG: anaerobic ribonucleoside-triphosphate reductase activating protein [Actinomycetota bacterium]